MFAGIGGFRSGLSHYGDFFVPVGYCEIDPYAKRAYEAIYEPKGEIYFEDARGIVPESLPDIDLICGGFPCQSFSIAGKRGGFEDARGTLFFEIARIARVKRPHFLLLENVPGLLSHDGGWTFATILGTLDELGYTYPFDDDCMILGNEEAKLCGMEGNRRLFGSVYAGPIFITRDNGEGDLCDLTDEQVKTYGEMFAIPEDMKQPFLKTNQ